MKQGYNGKNRGKNQLGTVVDDETNNFPSHQCVSDEWASRVKAMLKGLSKTESDIVSGFWEKIVGMINYTIGLDSELSELESLEAKKFNLECYHLIKGIEYLKKNKLKKLKRFRQARKITYWRKLSMHDSLIRQRENIQINGKNYKIEKDDEGHTIDIGYPDPEFDWASLVYFPDISKMDPEQFCIQAEMYQKLNQVPSLLLSSNKKRAPEFLRIFETQMQGVDVSSDHGPELGIDEENIANFKHQLIEYLRVIFSEADPELSDKINTYRAQKGKEWEVKKSTADERKALFRDPYFEKPGKIKHYKVIEGELIYLGEIDPSLK